MWVDFKIFKILYKLNYSDFYFINIVIMLLPMHFNWFFSGKAYFKVCIEVQKIWLPFFPCQYLLLSTIILYDTYILMILYICTSYNTDKSALPDI